MRAGYIIQGTGNFSNFLSIQITHTKKNLLLLKNHILWYMLTTGCGLECFVKFV